MPQNAKAWSSAGAAAAGPMSGGCTLDIEHMNMLSAVQKRAASVQRLRHELDAMQREVAAIQERAGALADDDYEELKSKSYSMQQVRTQIGALESDGDVLEYYQRAGDILFQYYNAVDNGGRSQPRPPPAARPRAQGAKSILNYFSAPSPMGEPAPARSSKPPAAREAPAAAPAARDDRATLFDKYATRMGARTALASAEQACRHCGSPDQTLRPQEGVLTCDRCHTVEYVLIDHDKPTYKDPPKEAAFAYKRINHLNEWLNQVQGKETTDIPDDVYDSILVEIKKRKITNMADLNLKLIKDILKKLRLNRYYEHRAHIINRLNGVPMPTLPSELEDRLRQMFCQIQAPFLKHQPNRRRNFLSYSFCLHKMLQLLDEDQYLSSFPLLKSREKLHQQDMIWRNICKELGWQFIPSM